MFASDKQFKTVESLNLNTSFAFPFIDFGTEAED